MARRPSKITEVLKKKYMGKSYSNTIMSTPVDYERLKSSPLTEEQVQQVKDKYNIVSYNSRDEFNFMYADDARRTIVQDISIANKTARERGEKEPYKFKNETTRDNYINSQITERLDKWYKYYEKRDLLIRSGQYDEIRLNIYKEQYLSHLELANMDKEVIQNINDLSLEQWRKLVEEPDVKVDSIKTRALPFLANIYSYTSNVDNRNNVRQEIKEAFDAVGLEWKALPETKARTNKRKKFEAIKDAYYRGDYNLHKNENGKWVAPLIGTEDGLDGDIVLELVEYIDKHSPED